MIRFLKLTLFLTLLSNLAFAQAFNSFPNTGLQTGDEIQMYRAGCGTASCMRNSILGNFGNNQFLFSSSGILTTTSNFVLTSSGVGASQYCDESGANCFEASDVASGSSTPGGSDRSIQFNNASALDGSSTFVYTSAGSVGIGTSTPSTALQVNGTVTATAFAGNASTATALQTARNIGGVSFDGTGDIVPQTVQAVDSSDATSFPAMFDSATGNMQVKTDSSLTYNASTGALAATTFSGAFSGNATTATALAANGANCSAGSAPIGVDASGAVESCTDYEEDLVNSAGLASAINDETGTGVAVFSSSGNLYNYTINASSSGAKALIVKAAASQATTIQEWQNSSGTALASISQTGVLSSAGLNTSGFVSLGGIIMSTSVIFPAANGLSFRVGADSNMFEFESTGGGDMSATNGISFKGRGTIYMPNVGEFAFRNVANTGYSAISAGTANFSSALGVNANPPSAGLHVNAASSGAKAAIIRGASSQTANLTEWQNNSSSVLSFVASSGALNTVDANFSSGWDGSTEVPTKNAVYDKFSTFSGGGGGSTAAAGNNGSIQFNNSSAFAGSANFVFNSANTTVSLGSANPSSSLQMDLSGSIGATQYCDSSGTNCANPAQILKSADLGVTVQGYASVLAGIAGSSANGFIATTSSGTAMSKRTITGTTNRLDVTNGNGVSGNPTLDIASTYVGQSSITTTGTLTSGATGSGFTVNFASSTLSGDVPLTAAAHEYCVGMSDFSTDLTTGTGKANIYLPAAATISGVRAWVNTAPVGSTIIVDINEAGSTILSTKLSIDASEKTSGTAASAAVISDTAIAANAELTFDIDQVGSSTAGKGLVACFTATF